MISYESVGVFVLYWGILKLFKFSIAWALVSSIPCKPQLCSCGGVVIYQNLILKGVTFLV